MKIADRAVLITGANRGLGRALVEETLRRGAKRVERAAVDREARPARLVGKMMKPLERPEGDGKGA